jgi:glycosyltransferase involved in cell wall biosynthesis
VDGEYNLEPIRVLQIVDSLNRRSGVSSVIMNLYRNIDRRKIQFDFLINFNDRLPNYEEEVSDLGGKIYRVTSPSLKNILTFVSEVNNFFKSNITYDIIHSHTPTLNVFFFPIAKRHNIINCIAHSHNSKYSDRKMNVLRNYLMLLPTNQISNVRLACSRKAGSFLFGEKSLEKGLVKIVNNAVDCEKFRFNKKVRIKLRDELNLNDKFVVGHVGRFSEQKNHIFLINIFREIHLKRKNAVLLLIGDGELKVKIQEQVNYLGLKEHVKFLGTRSDIHEVMQSMDVFVMPSLFEGLPVVGVEAQAAGLPCFFSDVVTDELAVTSNISYISLEDSANSWANIIINNSSSIIRKDTYSEIQMAGFDIKCEVKKLEELYLNLSNETKDR